MSYPLINPFQQFLDTSGDPLVDGTIEFRDPTSNALIDSFPTADDADAQTNANDNPLTLNSSGAAPGGLFLEDGVDYKVIIKDAAGATVVTYDDVLCPVGTAAAIGALLWPISALETSNGVTPTDYTYPWGDTRRYGSVADSNSSTTTQGTDNTAAFQRAIDSGHPVYVPEGDYSIEGTLVVSGGTGVTGSPTVVMNSKVRLERYTSVVTPLIHIYGLQFYVDGQGAQIAARSYGGFTKGLVLIGPDPEAADVNDSSAKTTNHGYFGNFKIIGKTSITGWDGSVGLYMESAARRRGQWVSASPSITTYYNHLENVYVSQCDYGIFLSTDVNANKFDGCSVKSYGHAAWYINGALNQISNATAELTPAQDSTERYAWVFGLHNSGPEQFEKTNEDATSVALSAITKGSPTTIDCAAVHGLSTGNTVWLEDIVDNGPDGDLEALLNDGMFKVTVTDTNSFTIPIDTSALTNTYSSGGTLKDSAYPALTGKANQISGYTETVYNASTAKVRLIGWTTPNGAYDLPRQFAEVYGLNVLNITGSLTGGIGPGGTSASSAIGNNIIRNNSVYKHPHIKADFNDFWFRKCDDQSAGTFGTNEYKVITGRLADIAASTTFDLFTIDNVGGGGGTATGGLIIKLSFVGKEQSGNDMHGGEISWLCPLNNTTPNTAIKYKDFQANENLAAFTFGVTNAAGTTANTGKYVLQVTTSGATGDFYMSWKVELMSSEKEGTNLDWDYDVTVQNGGQ